MAKAKITFGAIPARAFGDPRLKGLHLKVLGVVALHDRLSAARKNGQGCWAGNKRLAEMIGCNYSNLSTALTELATWGYIDRRTNPMNKTRRILFVVYDERDDAVMKSNRDENPLPTGKQSAADDSLPTGEDDAVIVCPDFQTSHKSQSLGGGEYIPLKRGRDSAEAGKGYSAEAGTNSVKTAPPYGDAKDLLRMNGTEPNGQDSDGQYLGKVQTWLKEYSSHILSDDERAKITAARDECQRIVDENEDEGSRGGVGGWAQRLAEELDGVIEEGTPF